jgi:hypothetical protein
MEIEAVAALVRKHLPDKYEPLMLSFYRTDVRTRGGRAAVIGDDYGTTLYCELDNGQVWSVDDKGRLRTRFVNSGIPELGTFLAEHARAIAPSGQASEAQRKDAIEALRSRFIEIDPAALADGDHWWATVVEQLRDGLL